MAHGDIPPNRDNCKCAVTWEKVVATFSDLDEGLESEPGPLANATTLVRSSVSMLKEVLLPNLSKNCGISSVAFDLVKVPETLDRMEQVVEGGEPFNVEELLEMSTNAFNGADSVVVVCASSKEDVERMDEFVKRLKKRFKQGG